MVSPTSRPGSEFRPDIEGLRGVAVLLVLLFHADLVGVPGGFIGVDVFFVISGFLITGLLLRERERSGRIGFRAFYARRVRRLLPAGLVALTATLVASALVLPPLDQPQSLVDGAAAALSVSNIRFAAASGDYFASVASPSPFLHFWSLSVEEQFYLAWPALLFLAARGRLPRVTLAVVLGVIAVTSLLVNLFLTDVAVNWAFYSLPSRAWQLAIGGLLAVAAQPLTRVPVPILVTGGWLGLVGLILASVVFDGSLAYPGLPALVPTLGAALLVASGTLRFGPGALLAVGPLRYLGRISYSLYLWHWPVLVLPAVALEAAPPLAGRLGLAGLAIILASLSWRLIEEPFRAGFPSLACRPGRTIVAGAVAVTVAVGTAGGLLVVGGGDLTAVPGSAWLIGVHPVAHVTARGGEAALDGARGDDEEDWDDGAPTGDPTAPADPGVVVEIGGSDEAGVTARADVPAATPAAPAPSSAPTATGHAPPDRAGKAHVLAAAGRRQPCAHGCAAGRGAPARRRLPGVRARDEPAEVRVRGSQGDVHRRTRRRLTRRPVVPCAPAHRRAARMAAADVRQGRLSLPRHADPEHRAEARVPRVRRVPRGDG